jgi:hypothetical protein
VQSIVVDGIGHGWSPSNCAASGPLG